MYRESIDLLWFWNYKLRSRRIRYATISMWMGGDLDWSMGIEIGSNIVQLNPRINGRAKALTNKINSIGISPSPLRH